MNLANDPVAIVLIKHDDAKPCATCGKATLYTVRGTGERVHRRCLPPEQDGSAQEDS